MDTSTKKTNMNKTWLIIAVLIVLTAILLVASIATKDSKPPAPTPTPEITKEISFATLKFSESPRISTVSGRYEIDVDLDTDKNEVTYTPHTFIHRPSTAHWNVVSMPGPLKSNPATRAMTLL